MPRRFIQPHDRLMFAAIGAWAVALAVFLLADKTADAEVWLHDLWPAMLLTGGVLTFAFAVRVASFRLRGLSNAVLVVACVGRGASPALGVVTGESTAVARSLAEMALFTMVAFLLYVTWRARVPRCDEWEL